MRARTVYFVIAAIATCYGNPCEIELSVDISDGDKIDTNIFKNGISYPPEQFFVVGETTRGCVCNIVKCFAKCCPLNQGLYNKTSCEITREESVDGLNDFVHSQLNVDSVYVLYQQVECLSGILYRRHLIDPGRNSNSEQNVHMTDDLEGLEEHANIFCVDSHRGRPVALVCEGENDGGSDTYHKATGMIISMPFLLVTFLVYAILPERNLPAKALMCYVLSLLFAYVMLVTIQLASNLAPTACTVVAYLCYFFFMVSFFWMNSSCIDIWLTFSGIKGMTGQRTQERKRFMYYSMYSWGLPLIMVCILIWANQSDLLPHNLKPLIGQGQCWFGNQLSTGVYFYFPIAFLVGSNIVLFAITAIKIIRVQRDTKMLNAKDSTKHENDKQRDDVCSDQICLTNRVENRGFEVYDFLDEDNSCFRFNLYVKLLFAMGVNWSMEIISWAVKWQIPTSGGWIWYLTDFCNAMYGVLIFFIFVFKKNIWVVLKKRYLQFTGKPQQAHRYGLSSTHRTTVSQVTSTSEA